MATSIVSALTTNIAFYLNEIKKNSNLMTFTLTRMIKDMASKIPIMVKDPDLNPIHPGEILKTEFLEPFNLTEKKLAKHLKTEERIINELVQEKRSITVDLAYRLYYYFGVSTQFWLNFQRDYDLEIYHEKEALKRQIKPYPRKEQLRVS